MIYGRPKKWGRRAYLGPAGDARAVRDAARRAAQEPGAIGRARRQPVRAATPKRAKQLREYTKLKERIMERKPRCAVCFHAPAVDLHHQRGRVGKLLCYEPFILPVCKRCHNAIHTKPEWAQREGWLGGAGQWNNQKQIK